MGEDNNKEKVSIIVIWLVFGFLLEMTALRYRNTMPFIGNMLIKHVFLSSIYPFFTGVLLFYERKAIEKVNKRYLILALVLLIDANSEPLFFWLISNLIDDSEIYAMIPIYGWNRIEYLAPVLSIIASYLLVKSGWICKVTNTKN